MSYMTFIENALPPAPAAVSAASDFAVPEALRGLAGRIADAVAPEIVKAADREVAARRRPSEEARKRAIERRLQTDRAFASEFRSAVARHAANQGIPESVAAPLVLNAYLKEV